MFPSKVLFLAFGLMVSGAFAQDDNASDVSTPFLELDGPAPGAGDNSGIASTVKVTSLHGEQSEHEANAAKTGQIRFERSE